VTYNKEKQYELKRKQHYTASATADAASQASSMKYREFGVKGSS